MGEIQAGRMSEVTILGGPWAVGGAEGEPAVPKIRLGFLTTETTSPPTGALITFFDFFSPNPDFLTF